MIYFAQTPTGSIKIGESDDVEGRITSLGRRYGGPTKLLAMVPGGPDEERAIHERFAHLRLGRTEQFQPGADLAEFIGCEVFVNPSEARPCGHCPSTRDDVVAKIDRGIVAQARYVADSRRIPLAEYLTEALRPIVRKDFDRTAKGGAE